MIIQNSWVEWAQSQINLLKDGGYIIFPGDGAIFQINKTEQTLNLVCCRPSWIGSDTENTNRQVFAKAKYRYVRADDVPTTLEGMIQKMFSNYQKYASDNQALIHGLGVIFGLKKDNGPNDDEVLSAFKKLGKKLPINPVTIRGDGNLTIGRLWIGTDAVPDSAVRFNPKEKRGQRWEKPVTLVIWEQESELNRATGMVVDEEDFIPAIKLLRNDDAHLLRLWGRTHLHSDNRLLYIFKRKQDYLFVTLYKGEQQPGPENKISSVKLNFDKFIDGLGHLFPNGELV